METPLAKRALSAGILGTALGMALCPTNPVSLSQRVSTEEGKEDEAEGSLAPAIRAKDIQAHVDYLASDELQGRSARSDEARLAAKYIVRHFQRFGLDPIGNEEDGDSYYLPIGDPKTSPNIVGILPGKAQGYVIVSAHYDHLPPKKTGEDRIFNGADDNASGVAGMLEIAQAFSARKKKTRATLVFIAFTAEERGLRGSRYFVAHPPFPMDQVRGVVNLDMISRGKKNLVFCEGGDCAPMRRAADKANKKVGLDIHYDKHPQWRRQSDHAPFMQKGIPTLYFGVEDHVDYHRVGDHADKILAELAARVSELTFLTLLDVANNSKSAGKQKDD